MAPIEVTDLWKSFGAVQAVRDLSFRVEPGRVTGFLGPNGAGKSTTLRILLGLVHPLRGDATIDGVHYDQLEDPSGRVGAMLEDTSFHPGRSGENHLRVLAEAGGHPQTRVDELIDLVSLRGAEERRVGQYSQGMRQRLALASAMIGDPGVLILDEPTNGLDPGGIRWLRGLMRQLAEQGRTVLVSSHLLAEVAQAVDDVVIIARGELRADGSLHEVLGGGGDKAVTDVRSPYPDHLRESLTRRGHTVERGQGEQDLVVHAEPEQVGIAAAEDGVTLYRLGRRERSLEDTFFELTADAGPRT
jgi:ABC-2 type transport system ATP-binding protein